MTGKNCLKITDKKPPVSKGRRRGRHLHGAQHNPLSRSRPGTPGQVLTSCPRPQELGLQLGCELARSGDASTKGARRAARAESIELSVDRGAANRVCPTHQSPAGCLGDNLLNQQPFHTQDPCSEGEPALGLCK